MKEKLVVLGAGESGIGAALLGKKNGFEVFVSDYGKIKEVFKKELTEADIPFEEGGHSWDRISDADLIVKSPGIPNTIALIRRLKEADIPVIGEVEFAFRYCEAKIIGITGSNGKTTTTLLLYHLLSGALENVGVGGNVGNSFARLMLEQKFDYLVLELSSFQLDDIQEFRPDIAILLNITADHLDRYDYKLDNYIQAKFRITRNQQKSDWFIYNKDDKNIRGYLEANVPRAKMHGVEFPSEISEVDWNAEMNYKVVNPALKGVHNQFNTQCALEACKILGIKPEGIQGRLDSFVNQPHRMELVGVHQGVAYINDSKATNVDAVYYALDAVDGPIVWVLGGLDKGNDYRLLDEPAREKVRAIVCLGADNSKIKEYYGSWSLPIIETRTAREAVVQAQKLASQGDTVLLSPACSSFDLFENFAQRGDFFREAVKEMMNEPK